MTFVISATRELSAAPSIRLFPNPASDRVLVELPESYSGNVALYDALGRMVYTLSVKGQTQVEIDLDRLQNGLYFVHLLQHPASQPGLPFFMPH